MFTIDNKPIFNFYNITTLLRGDHLKTPEEKIENYIKYAREVLYIERNIIQKSKSKSFNLTLEEFCELNPISQMYSKQIDFKNNKISNDENIVKFEYQKLFAINPEKTYDNIIVSNKLTPEEIKIRKSWDISLTSIKETWGRLLFTNMLPKFEFTLKDVTPDFINIIIIIQTLLTKSIQHYLKEAQSIKHKDIHKNMSWEALDKFIEDLNSELHFENGKLIETDKAFDLLSQLTSGKIEFYHQIEDIIIYTPLFHIETGSDKELLTHVYNLFQENPIKYNHLIACLVHNFVKDDLDIPLKLTLPRKTLFFEVPGDSVIDLTYKICNIIFNMSGIKSGTNNILDVVYSRIRSLFEFLNERDYKLPNKEIQMNKYQEAIQNDNITEPSQLSKFQYTAKNVVIMKVLTEIFSGEKINFSLKDKQNKHRITNYIVSKWDNLINDMMNSIDKYELIGYDYSDVKDFMSLMLTIEFKPIIIYNYINSNVMYVNRNNPEFIKWMNENVCKFGTDRLHRHCIECWKNIHISN